MFVLLLPSCHLKSLFAWKFIWTPQKKRRRDRPNHRLFCFAFWNYKQNNCTLMSLLSPEHNTFWLMIRAIFLLWGERENCQVSCLIVEVHQKNDAANISVPSKTFEGFCLRIKFISMSRDIHCVYNIESKSMTEL